MAKTLEESHPSALQSRIILIQPNDGFNVAPLSSFDAKLQNLRRVSTKSMSSKEGAAYRRAIIANIAAESANCDCDAGSASDAAGGGVAGPTLT